MSKVQEILDELKSLRNDKMFAHNLKSGAGKDNQFGVKMGDIRNIAKRLKSNHALALQLWDTKYMEAKLLAILIAEPKKLSARELNEMVKTIDFAWVADWFNSYILKDHPAKDELRNEWMESDNKWAARSGWSLTAGKIARDAAGLDVQKLLARIEKEMPLAAPEIQWTMNTALANIGIHYPEHRKRALEIGEKLGIYRDYPVSKGCTSPFAPIWINEMVSRLEKQR